MYASWLGLASKQEDITGKSVLLGLNKADKYRSNQVYGSVYC